MSTEKKDTVRTLVSSLVVGYTYVINGVVTSKQVVVNIQAPSVKETVIPLNELFDEVFQIIRDVRQRAGECRDCHGSGTYWYMDSHGEANKDLCGFCQGTGHAS